MDKRILYENLLNYVYEGMYFVDVDRKITFWNQGAERITGYKAEEVVGSYCYDNILNHVDEKGNKLCFGGCPLHATIKDGKNRDAHVYLQHKSGSRINVKVRTTPIIENGKNIGAVELFIEEVDKFAEFFELVELREIAYRDQLTGLPNRRFLDENLMYQMEMARKLDVSVGIAFIDIDFFKKVNDTYGHLMGDETLKVLAKTLTKGLRTSDIVGRWGGEEFILILPNSDSISLEVLCEKLRMLVENSSVDRSNTDLKITISIGATIMRKSDTLESIINRADCLLYESKENGRNRVTIR
ncbi:sensor domain-containing diguanylate cyclase [Petrocella sp. FN5]|uniref:sensor domain-containing diguanylate cyclase n=1 Tax=Petrocella sp. FN5 TaxID=3032002 RepID=UPI0023DADA62|nr:sensor domain-containing diguanylate cyclase [Petrocella sp. FN5]MDF1617940.1 sensor domain-containing diguanylate cyclase [Petrocella sp. FN5]